MVRSIIIIIIINCCFGWQRLQNFELIYIHKPYSICSSVAFLNVFTIAILGLAAAKNLGQTIPNAAKEDCTAQILQRQEGIMDAQQDRGELEVHQEYDNTKVD